MKVTIWDLDYYHAANKRDKFNPDAMKISSYHKQLGDQINFVLKEDDIHRPYDLYYIIKEDSKTPNAPLEFYTDCKVRWWGTAYKRRINWKMPDIMLACRPDYLLYPEKDTQLERAEHVRLLNSKGDLLPIHQDWRNSFKNKKVIETDDLLWTTSRENLISALKILRNTLNLTFFEPIWLPKMIDDKEVTELFLKLNITQNSHLQFTPVPIEDYEGCAAIVEKMKQRWNMVEFGAIRIKIFHEEHWLDREAALQDMRDLIRIILDAKKRKIKIEIVPMRSRLDSPYFLIFEELSEWMQNKHEYSWLEWLTYKYGPGLKFGQNNKYWAYPGRWQPAFRDLLRQTWTNTDLLLLQWGNRRLSANDIPWTIWNEELKYGL